MSDDLKYLVTTMTTGFETLSKKWATEATEYLAQHPESVHVCDAKDIEMAKRVIWMDDYRAKQKELIEILMKREWAQGFTAMVPRCCHE